MSILAAIGWKVVPRISIGPLRVSPHGLGIAAGYAAGGSLLARRAERLYGISREHVWNMLMWAVGGVIIGARLFYVVGHIDEYWPNVVDIVKIWEGGIVFYGGVFGGIVAAVPYMRKHNLRFWHVMDAAAPGFPLGLIFGRIGDLVIGDHLGGPTTAPWGFEYRGGELPECPAGIVFCPPPVGSVFHQTALYDLVNVLILFPVAMWLGRKRRPDGFLIMFVATWYGGARLATDFARTAPTYLGLRGTQWVSVAIILAGTWHLVRLARRGFVVAELPEPAPAPVAEAGTDPDVVQPATSADDADVQTMIGEGSPDAQPGDERD